LKWVLVIWLASSSDYTIYEKFRSEEECLSKQKTVTAALAQAESKMKIECRTRKPGDVFKQNGIVVNRYVLR
jgi:hypothetical protein